MLKLSFSTSIALFIFLMSVAVPVLSEPLQAEIVQELQTVSGLPVAAKNDLLNYQKSSRYFDNPPTNLLYSNEETARIILKDLASLEPNVGAESVYLIPLNASQKENANFPIRLYNQLHAISSMKGIEYFSHSRQRMRIMFHDAYVLDGKKSRNRVDDPLFEEIPRASNIIIHQKDSSFGNNDLTVTYNTDENTTHILMQNLTTMFYGIIPLISPDDLHMHITVTRHNNFLLVHGICAVRTISFFGLEKRYESFANRIEALKNWIEMRL